MNTARGKILIADDDPTVRIVLTKLFEKSGFEVIAAQNGREAVERLSRDILAVILDLEMPELDGIECLRYIQQHMGGISPIMLTASEDISSAVEAMRSGAFDYITKPFNPQKLIALVDKAIATDAQAKRLRQVEAELAKAREQEIEMAARIQQTLLMGAPPQNFKGVEIANTTIPSHKVDGDFYDFIVIDSQRLDVLVGDVMGKGIASALMGAATKSYFLRVIREVGCSACQGDVYPEPDAIVSRVQAAMIHQMEALETFVTLCYARFDLASSQMRFVDCGHMRTIHYHCQTGDCSLLEGVNMPLGFPETLPFTLNTVSFAPGDFFVFYSDGLTEAMTPEGRIFGEDRLTVLVQGCADAPPDRIIHRVWKNIVTFSGSETFRDDFTCVVVKITPPDTMRAGVTAAASTLPSSPTPTSMTFFSDLKELSRVRHFIRDGCLAVFPRLLNEDRISMIELAVTEVVTNIIRHAYEGVSDRPIDISIGFESDALTIEFLDQGKSFDPNRAPPPKFDGSQEGGFGLYIISHIADDVVYEKRRNNTNCTRLKIYPGRGANGDPDI